MNFEPHQYGVMILLILSIFLGVIMYISYLVRTKVNKQELEEFTEKLKKTKYATCEYVYDNPFIPALKDYYIVKEIKNGWVRLIQIKSPENPIPYHKTEEESYCDLPIKEAYQVLNLQIIE